MAVVTSTQFIKNFGRFSMEAQREPVTVTNHGQISGYFISAHEYDRLRHAAQEVIPYRSIREMVLAQRKDILALAKKRHATRIRLFGSVAAGEDGPDSDIDFLVDFPARYDLMEDRFGLALDLEELLGRRIDLVVEAELNKTLAPHILRSAVDL